MTDQKDKITIDIVSDIACPWCFVGKKRMEAALAQLPEVNAEILWHPFQLDPTIPPEGINREAYFTKKFGGKERTAEIIDNMNAVGDSVGIKFNFEQMEKAINTLPLHKLLLAAIEEGNQDALKQHLFIAYFEQGVDFSDRKNIIATMEDFGWDAAKTTEIIDNPEITSLVEQAITNSQNMGITGVPFFIFNNKYGFSGAQAPQVFVDTIRKIQSEQHVAVANADTCAIDDKDC